MTTYNDSNAWAIAQPYYDMIRATLPHEEAGKPFAEAFRDKVAKLASQYSAELRWQLIGNMLDDISSLAESYGIALPVRMLAHDWLIECGTIGD